LNYNQKGTNHHHQLSAKRLKDTISALKDSSPKRDRIFQLNGTKKPASILSNLYKVDPRAIRFTKARQQILLKQQALIEKHRMKSENSRSLLPEIQYWDTVRRRKEMMKEG